MPLEAYRCSRSDSDMVREQEPMQMSYKSQLACSRIPRSSVCNESEEKTHDSTTSWHRT